MKKADTNSGNWKVGATLALIMVLILYPLSLGPMLWLVGAKPGSGWNGVPEPIQTIYMPLSNAPMPEWIVRPLERYTIWWMSLP
jgi:hypothetical protein